MGQLHQVYPIVLEINNAAPCMVDQRVCQPFAPKSSVVHGAAQTASLPRSNKKLNSMSRRRLQFEAALAMLAQISTAMDAMGSRPPILVGGGDVEL
jgi:hypothetical protein